MRPVSGDAENGKVFAKAPRNTSHNPMKRFMRSRTIWEGNRHLGLRGQFERVLSATVWFHEWREGVAMLCTKSGSDLPDDSRFRRSCGQTLGVVSVGGGAAAVAPTRIPAPEPKPSSELKPSPEPKSRNVIWSVAGVVLLLALFAASWYVQWKNSNSLPQSQAEQVTQPE